VGAFGTYSFRESGPWRGFKTEIEFYLIKSLEKWGSKVASPLQALEGFIYEICSPLSSLKRVETENIDV